MDADSGILRALARTNLRQAKLHANFLRPIPRPVVKPTGGPEPMDLSLATGAGPQQRRGSTNVRCFRCGNNGHYARECTAPVHAAKGRREDTGYRHGQAKTKTTSRRGAPAGDAVERVDIGHAVSKAAAPSESHSHCKKKDDKPNLVILKVNAKRRSSFRALVDCGASNKFVRLQSLARLDFEEVELPRSLLEVRLATGVVVRTEEKRVVRARFLYEEKKFVDELIVLDLDDKFDMVLGMPWLARHDPEIDWAKRTVVRFRGSGATESDGPVGAAHAPRGACYPPAEAARGAAASDLSARTLTTERVVSEKCEPNQKPQIQSDLRGSRSVKSDAIVPTVVDTQVEQEWPVTEGSDLGASAPGADSIGPNIKGRSAVRRRGKRGASAPGADAASSSGGCKRPAPKILACSHAAGLYDEAIHNQAGLDCVCPRADPAVDQKKDLSTAGPGQHKTRGTGFRTRSERRKRAQLRKSRSGTEATQAASAGQTQQLDTTVETLSVLTRTDTGLQYRKMALESPPTLASELTSLPAMSWKRFARDLHDGRIEQICILSDVERMEREAEKLKQLVTEGADTLSAKSKKERFDEQSWGSLKSSPLYEVLREYKGVLPDDIPPELPQDKGVQHEIDLSS
ncbi:unnamed protein product [Phytophthora fragariaefolia]|uniref:Unnamed protein product n=1 Tax=Phytophthora fragariaefolia TaxID=1490495 RepID=A0A9W6Y723_9STRA|nr:unnamed protein product [Phytophthora fragariaefolia]